MDTDNILTALSIAVSFLAVCVSLYSVIAARRTALTGTYFSEMASAYSGYLESIARFAYHRGATERDALSVALYRVELFASGDISRDAQGLYVYLLRWAASRPAGALDIDQRVNALGREMRIHLEHCRRGKWTA